MISIIVAAAENDCIGKNNQIPWNLPKDLKHFVETTSGHKVIMGRGTYESIISHIGKPLPKRENIVVTRNKNFQAPGCAIANTLDEAIALGHDDEEVFIIGGAQIYKEALPYVDRVYKTLVHTAIDGDAFFPKLNEKIWHIVKEDFVPRDEKNQFDMTFLVYER